MGHRTLSVCVLTWNSGARLARQLGELAIFCDELIVGVDAESDQETYEIACRWADVVFRFEHVGIVEPARLIPLEYSSCDWLLVLDDDEAIDDRFADLKTELLEDTRYTHYFFPTKWIASEDPSTYFCGPPWYPDWHPRLLRNDRSLVWHSPVVHTGYRVQGSGCYEARISIVHYGLILCTGEDRRAKLERYRIHGSKLEIESYYLAGDSDQRCMLERPYFGLATGVPRPARKPDRRCRVVPQVQPANQSALPAWRAKLEVEMPAIVRAGQSICVEVTVTNVGALAWFPAGNAISPLGLSYHVRDPEGPTKIWDGDRTPIGRVVAPGASILMLAMFTAPGEPGEYIVEWDMVSEGECWFAQCNSQTQIVPVLIVDAGAGSSAGYEPTSTQSLSDADLRPSQEQADRGTAPWRISEDLRSDPAMPGDVPSLAYEHPGFNHLGIFDQLCKQNTHLALIVGCQRSGTTLLRLILDSHPAVATFEEPTAYDYWAEANLLARTVEAGQVDGRVKFVFKTPCLTEQLDRDDGIATDLGYHVFPFSFGYNGELLLFLVRDPRDVYLSLRKLKEESSGRDWIDLWPQYIDDLYPRRITDFYNRYARELEIVRRGGTEGFAARAALYWKIKTEAFFRYDALGYKMLLIIYEDLVTNPQRCLQRVTRFLGVPFAESMLRHHELAHTGLFADGLTAGKTDPKRRISSESTRLYRSRVSKEEQEIIIDIAGHTYRAIQRKWLQQLRNQLVAECLPEAGRNRP